MFFFMLIQEKSKNFYVSLMMSRKAELTFYLKVKYSFKPYRKS